MKKWPCVKIMFKVKIAAFMMLVLDCLFALLFYIQYHIS